MNGLGRRARIIICFAACSLCAAAEGFSQKPSAATDAVDVLVIDAGHGGHDAGAVGKKAREKDINLSVALKFGQAVKCKYPDVKVVYTRSTDVFVELWQRGQIANDHHADLFISIHCNSTGGSVDVRKKARGTETWIRGTETDAKNLEQVQRENEVIKLEKNYGEQYSQSWMDQIAATVHQGINFENSVDFAVILQDVYRARIPDWPDRSVKQGKLYVLWKSARPSVLTEIGFLSNDEGEAFLSGEEGQAKIVECLLEAFSIYKDRIDSRSGIKSSAGTVGALPEAAPKTAEPKTAADSKTAAPSGDAPKKSSEVASKAAEPRGVEAKAAEPKAAESTAPKAAPSDGGADTPVAAVRAEQTATEGFIPSPSEMLADSGRTAPGAPATVAPSPATPPVAVSGTSPTPATPPVAVSGTSPTPATVQETASTPATASEAASGTSPTPATVQEAVSPPATASTSATASKGAIVYRVQILATRNKVELLSDNFRGLAANALSRRFDSESNIYKYYFGFSNSYDGIQKDLETARKAGYTGAFPAAFEDGSPVSLSEARKREAR